MNSYLIVMNWKKTKNITVATYLIDNPRFAQEGMYPEAYRVLGKPEVIKGGLFPWDELHSLEKLPE